MTKTEKIRKISRILLFISDILYLPCLEFAVFNFIACSSFRYGYAALQRITVGLNLPMCFLRIYYIPYIFAAFVFCFYIIGIEVCINQKIAISKKSIIIDLVCWIIFIAELLYIEPSFNALMWL